MTVRRSFGHLVEQALVDAKGDLLAASAADILTRLPVGTDGQVLTAQSAESLGLAWEDAAAGGGGGGDGLLAWAHDNTSRSLTAANTWEDVSGTTITFTPNRAGDHVVVVEIDWEPASANWQYHKVRVLLDDATTGVAPAEWIIHQIDENEANNPRYKTSARFILSGLSVAEHTIKLQTHDQNSGLDRTFRRTIVEVWGAASGGETGTEGAWTTYDPAWTAATTNPGIGNGTKQGAYLHIGRRLYFRINLIMGSTTTFGSGDWSFGLPAGITAKAGAQQAIVAHARDAGTAFYMGVARILSNATSFQISDPADTVTTRWRSDSPFTWSGANADELEITGVIEVNEDGAGVVGTTLSALGPWGQTNVQGTVTDQAVEMPGAFTSAQVVMPYAGRIRALTVRLNEARTAGTLTLIVQKNGAALSPSRTVVIDGTNTVFNYVTYTYEDAVTFAAGDRLRFVYTTSGFTPTTADMLADIWVSFD